MTSSSARARSRRASASVASGSLVLLALTAVPTTAEAVSPSIDYTCSATGVAEPFPLPVVLDTSAPQRMTTGQATQLVLTAKATLSDEYASKLAPGSTSVQAALNPRVSAGAFAAEPATTVPPTAITSDPAPAILNGSSVAFPFTAPATPGSLEVTAGTITGTLRFTDGGGTPTPRSITCTVPNGKPPVVDTLAIVSATATTLTTSRSTAAYGQGVTASARVTSSSGVPAGEVAFTVGNTVTRARVDKDGVATLAVPDMPIGTHAVVATFVPSDASSYVGSTSVTQLLTVSKAETILKIPVTGRTTKKVTRVEVKAEGRYDTVPTGRVRITVKRLGKAGRWSRDRTLAGGSARLGFGSLKVGRYKAVVKYAGDASHLSAKKTRTFRVKPG